MVCCPTSNLPHTFIARPTLPRRVVPAHSSFHQQVSAVGAAPLPTEAASERCQVEYRRASRMSIRGRKSELAADNALGCARLLRDRLRVLCLRAALACACPCNPHAASARTWDRTILKCRVVSIGCVGASRSNFRCMPVTHVRVVPSTSLYMRSIYTKPRVKISKYTRLRSLRS